MVIFLFISISYMLITQIEQKKIEELTVLSTQKQNELYEALNMEFKNDLAKWNAVIDQQTLSVKFQTPDILFKAGSDILAVEFKNILQDFYPRYIKTLSQPKFRDDIEEIRIEGHTSSEWAVKVSENDAYHNNMRLSQNRTLSVLQFVNNLDEVSQQKKWLQSKTIAIGKSSSQIVMDKNGFEDKEKSRRVEFMVKTNAEIKIIKMIQEIIL
ncbi:MAG: OmpA family protein [Candidatus Kapabacteria bacterium]|nr:OmpA family protein [Ignavibacteriota bacterium]MCW5883410.1 OmpA family protein [Candidatus Kapabacteria bacterium]